MELCGRRRNANQYRSFIDPRVSGTGFLENGYSREKESENGQTPLIMDRMDLLILSRDNSNVMEVRKRNTYLSPSLKTFQAYNEPLVMEKGMGQWIWDVEDFDQAVMASTPGRIAGFIVEPIQGYGGVSPMPEGYLPEVFERTREAGGLYGNVIKINPPMCIRMEDVDLVVEVLDLGLARL